MLRADCVKSLLQLGRVCCGKVLAQLFCLQGQFKEHGASKGPLSAQSLVYTKPAWDLYTVFPEARVLWSMALKH